MNKKLLRKSIRAADSVIDSLQNSSSISTSDLRIMSQALGETFGNYTNKADGFIVSDEEQSRAAIDYLNDFIHDRKIELRSKNRGKR